MGLPNHHNSGLAVDFSFVHQTAEDEIHEALSAVPFDADEVLIFLEKQKKNTRK